MAINKQTAGVLYGYGYKLKDSDGNVYDIDGVGLYGVTLYNGDYHDTVEFDQIGTTYKILARDLEQLTQEIDGKVPLVEMSTYKDILPFLRASYFNKKYTAYFGTPEEHIKFEIDKDVKNNKQFIVDKMADWHFNIGFPDNTATNLI